MSDERKEEIGFFKANEDLFVQLAERMGSAALQCDYKTIERYVLYLERIIQVSLNMAKATQREEIESGHA